MQSITLIYLGSRDFLAVYVHFVPVLLRCHGDLPCEQRFSSCMAFSVNEVVRVVLSERSFFVLRVAWGVQNKPSTRLTSHENDFVNA